MNEWTGGWYNIIHHITKQKYQDNQQFLLMSKDCWFSTSQLVGYVCDPLLYGGATNSVFCGFDKLHHFFILFFTVGFTSLSLIILRHCRIKFFLVITDQDT